jgi:hypothetical protein
MPGSLRRDACDARDRWRYSFTGGELDQAASRVTRGSLQASPPNLEEMSAWRGGSGLAVQRDDFQFGQGAHYGRQD